MKSPATETNTMVLPDARNVIAFADTDTFSRLIRLKNQIEELTETYEAERLVAQTIVEEARLAGRMDKTFVLGGTEITYTTRRSHVFSERVQRAEEELKRRAEFVKSLKDAEIKDGRTEAGATTNFLTISGKASLVYDPANDNWISTFKTRAKAA